MEFCLHCNEIWQYAAQSTELKAMDNRIGAAVAVAGIHIDNTTAPKAICTKAEQNGVNVSPTKIEIVLFSKK